MAKTVQSKKEAKVSTANVMTAENGAEVISASEAVKKAFAVQKGAISKCMDNVKGSYLKIGLALIKIHKGNMYVLDGYKNITDFSEGVFGLPRATTNNSMNIVKKFCDDGKATLMDTYKDYNFTQLVEMIPMSDELLEQCNPTMSAQQLRELKKQAKTLVQKTDMQEEKTVSEDEETEKPTEQESAEADSVKEKEYKAVDVRNMLALLVTANEEICFMDEQQLGQVLRLMDDLGAQDVKVTLV